MSVVKRARVGVGSRSDGGVERGRPLGDKQRGPGVPAARAADSLEVPGAGHGGERERGERPASGGPESDADVPADGGGRRRRRADLRQDTIEILRDQRRRLKVAAREAQREMKNAKKRRNMVLARLRNLDTASVLAVLTDRVENPSGAPSQLEAAVADASREGLSPQELADRVLPAPAPVPAAHPDDEPRTPTDADGEAAGSGASDAEGVREEELADKDAGAGDSSSAPRPTDQVDREGSP